MASRLKVLVLIVIILGIMIFFIYIHLNDKYTFSSMEQSSANISQHGIVSKHIAINEEIKQWFRDNFHEWNNETIMTYIQLLAQNGYNSIHSIQREQDLTAIGIDNKLDRIEILHQIHELKTNQLQKPQQYPASKQIKFFGFRRSNPCKLPKLLFISHHKTGGYFKEWIKHIRKLCDRKYMSMSNKVYKNQIQNRTYGKFHQNCNILHNFTF